MNIDPKRVSVEDFVKRTGREPESIGGAEGPRGQGASEKASALGPSAPRLLGPYCFEVHTHGGRKPTGIEALPYARRVVELGAGEILLTSMDADGTKAGYDLEVTRLIGEAVDVPLVASGGCGCPGHMIEVLQQTRADAVLAASIFHYGEYSIAETKRQLAEAGLPVRPTTG